MIPNPTKVLSEARAGIPGGLGRLLELHQNYLKLLAQTQLDEKLRARVSPSDVVQDTLLEAHRDFANFRGECEAEFLNWLRQILVHNLARIVERHVLAEKRDVRREVSLDEVDRRLDRSAMRLQAVLADRVGSPSAAVQTQEHVVLLADALAELPADYRRVIVLRNLESLPFKEVAERMNRSAGATRMLWLRAIDQLRQGLSARGLV
jgi:RNA polymerase sigma-70 factor (ECF subfamily)